MQTVGLRTYKVESGDFPIEVVVQANELAACRGVASDVQVVKTGTLVGSIAVTVTNDAPNLACSYQIRCPNEQPPCDLVQTVHCWFDDDAPDSADYQITIQPGNGDAAKTTVSRPTINPGAAVLVFHYR